jgi:hypothetical protein
MVYASQVRSLVAPFDQGIDIISAAAYFDIDGAIRYILYIPAKMELVGPGFCGSPKPYTLNPACNRNRNLAVRSCYM